MLTIIFVLGLIFLSCDYQLTSPDRNNPFDPNNYETNGDPFNLTLSENIEGVNISWNKIEYPSPEMYYIYRQKQEDEVFTLIGEVAYTDSSYIDNIDGVNVIVNEPLLYKVVAIMDSEQIDNNAITSYNSSKEVNISLNFQIENIFLRPRREDGVMGVRIDWELNSIFSPQYYRIYRSQDLTGNFQLLGTSSITSIFDNSITEDALDATYYYYILGVFNEYETNLIPEEIQAIAISINVPGSYDTIQEVIDSSINGDIIHVSSGTYYENISYDGKKISLECNNTIDDCVIDGNGSGPIVIFNNDEDSTSVIDGFTFKNGSNTQGGGAMVIIQASPLIKNCVFDHNESSYRGGAISIDYGDPIIRYCIFEDNFSEDDGGAIFSGTGSDPIIHGCEFTQNEAMNSGGAISTLQSRISINSCQFTENITYGSGGAISMHSVISGPSEYTAKLNGSTFLSNSSNGLGGAIYIYNARGIHLLQCRFENNFADRGGGVYIEDSGGASEDDIMFENCILWNNTAQYGGGGIYSDSAILQTTHLTAMSNHTEDAQGDGILLDNSQLDISHSIWWQDSGSANQNTEIYVNEYSSYTEDDNSNLIEFDPLFIYSNIGDFHLQEGSPCIGNPDMGAYGGINGTWE